MRDKEIEERIKKFIENNTFADKQILNNETLLFEEGIFDSMGLVLLISFLEEEFHIHTDDHDLVLENFESINAITQYILRPKTGLN